MDASPVGKYERLSHHIDCIRAALERLEGRHDILGSPDFRYGGLKAECAGRCLNPASLKRRVGIADIGHDRQTAQTWDSLTQKLDPLAGNIRPCVREHPKSPEPEKTEPETTISGTGFFVAPKRVVTNNHVVNACTKDIQVRYPDGRPYTATISGQDATNDLVLLHTEMPNLSVASFRFQPLLGEAVATYGFPYSGILSPNFTSGDIAALSGPKGDTRFLQTSTPIQPGNSGGPLLDMSGRVVGVVVAQLSAVPNQNVNFAIQPSMIINFLEAKDVTPKLDAPKAPRTPSEVCEIAKKFTVQIYCKGVAPKTSESAGSAPSSSCLRGNPLTVNLNSEFLGHIRYLRWGSLSASA